MAERPRPAGRLPIKELSLAVTRCPIYRSAIGVPLPGVTNGDPDDSAAP
jgi:hypothetical protein